MLSATPNRSRVVRRSVFFSLTLRFFFLFVTCASTWAAQPDRIVGVIDSGQVVVLKGNVNPKAQPQYDQGPVESSMKLPYVTILTKPTAAQQADLRRFLKQQQEPSSPNYRKGLTPEQYADRFGLSQTDIGKITNWLASQGFGVVQVARGRDWIAFSGTAGLVSKVFRTEIHFYLVDGEQHFANATQPSVPQALADIVVGFRGLNDFRLKPMGLRKLAPGATLLPDIVMRPFYTSGIGNNLGPDDLATIYDISPLYTAGINGTGMKLVVVGQTDVHMTDITEFRAGFNLPTNNPTVTLVPGSPDPGYTADEGEADLDLEWSGAVARNATIIFVNSATSVGGVINSAQYAIDNQLAPVISMSYGACESANPPSDIATIEQLLQRANVENITFLASSGDAGAAGCDSDTESVAIDGLAVNYPASSPEVTGVGGNEFSGDVNNAGKYWNSSNNANGESAISYIPEMAWNDSPQTGTGLSPTLAASGGGVSSCAIASGTGCAGFPKPSWQTALTPKDGVRDVPDVSMTASPDHDGYIFCTNVGTGGNYVGSCANGIAQAVANFSIVGGTSASTPVFAGIVTLLNQSLGNTGAGAGLGNINQTLYQLFQTSPSVFHDVTTGSNIVPCQSGTIGCPKTAPFQYGYSAAVGYDQVTGLGSVDADLFVTQLSGKVATTTTLTASPASPVNFGTSVTLTATVKPASGTTTPTGTVTFFKGSTALNSTPVSLANGAAAFTSTTLAGGSYSITAVFSPATGTDFSGSTSSALTYNVQDFQIAANPATVSVTAPGGSGTTTLTITPLGGFSATVSYSCTGLPSEATCTFPTAATGGTLTISTTAPSSRMDKDPFGRHGGIFYALMLPGFVGLVVSASNRRRRFDRRLLSLIAVLALSTLWMAGCGGSSKSSNPGTPAGTSTVTVTATAGTLKPPPVSITLTVQ
jgi:subtilase family serine protease